MPMKPNQFRPLGWKEYDTRSKEATGYRRFYKTYKWQKARAAFLNVNSTCVMCAAEGKIRLADVVDHIVPHRGDEFLFWDTSNWQALCKQHHDRDKQREEKSVRGGDSKV